MNETLTDRTARDDALDISRSFIVQAPAGSGKTGLLTLRFLRLLTVSENPEEILAITFTRKAASEMQERIVQTLFWAAEISMSGELPVGEFEQQRFNLAIDVLNRDREMQWQLLQNPSRLRIQTIDSFCLYLANRLPILSKLGANPRIAEDVDHVFHDAITNTLLHLEEDKVVSNDIERILIHLDNDSLRLQRLLVSLLRKRDQWLPYVLAISKSSHDASIYTKTCIEELVEESLLEVRNDLTIYSNTIVVLTNFAIQNFRQLEPPKYIDEEKLSQLPKTSIGDISTWRIIANLLLTQSGSWRRSVDKRSGFPTGNKYDEEYRSLCKMRKEQIYELLGKISDNDDLLHALNYLRLLPDSSIDKNQWEFFTSLTRILAKLGTELLISFRRLNLIDYIEIGAAARAALGDQDNPTDLALTLDHQIQHILIDEFQDTSQLQLDILEQLISGWEPQDQRTLFLVGDSLQSCYGFRNANVGIYLNVQHNGLPQVDITPLQLQTNFRSDAGIVEWINRHFETAFPAKANPSRGAVPYYPARAINAKNLGSGVSTEIISFKKNERSKAQIAEAKRVIDTIQTIREKSPKETIAVLVRSRSHLEFIIPELQASSVDWISTDIDRMGSVQIIEDLLSLTKALLNPSDRLSWFAILRAPWTGILLSDLLTIALDSLEEPVWLSINKLQNSQKLSSDGQNRLKDFIDCIRPAMAYRYRVSLRELVQTSWELLRGAAAIENEREKACVACFLNLLEEHDTAGGIKNLESFQQQVYKSFVPSAGLLDPDNKSNAIQLLTMHKSKGLEFDHVIIPGLASQPLRDHKPLFAWHERLNKKGQARLFASALTETGAEDDDLYRLILHEKQNKALLESTRLLYIAITRARKSVKLLAVASINDKQELQISPQSLLSRIWREVCRESADFQIKDLSALQNKSFLEENKDMHSFQVPTPFKRFQQTRGLTQTERCYLESEKHLADYEIMEKPRTQETAIKARVGKIIHATLEEYTNSEDKHAFLTIMESKKKYWELQLKNLAYSNGRLNDSLYFICETIKDLTTTEELNWIFDASSEDSQTELSISSITNGKLTTHIIDRTFIDSKGVRWIIDYKTNVLNNEKEEESLSEQAAMHATQLARYKMLFTKLESRKIKTAVLFTSIPKLVEI